MFAEITRRGQREREGSGEGEERWGGEPAAEGGQNLWFFLDFVCYEYELSVGRMINKFYLIFRMLRVCNYLVTDKITPTNSFYTLIQYHLVWNPSFAPAHEKRQGAYIDNLNQPYNSGRFVSTISLLRGGLWCRLISERPPLRLFLKILMETQFT